MRLENVYSKRRLAMIIAIAVFVAGFFVCSVGSSYAGDKQATLMAIMVDEDNSYSLNGDLSFDLYLNDTAEGAYNPDTQYILPAIIIFEDEDYDTIDEAITDGVSYDAGSGNITVTKETLMKLIKAGKLDETNIEGVDHYQFFLYAGAFDNSVEKEVALDTDADIRSYSFIHIKKPQITVKTMDDEDTNNYVRLFREEDRKFKLYLDEMDTVEKPAFKAAVLSADVNEETGEAEIVGRLDLDAPVQVEDTNEYIMTVTKDQIEAIEKDSKLNKSIIYIGLYEDKENLDLVNDNSLAAVYLDYDIEDAELEFEGSYGDRQMIVGWEEWFGADTSIRVTNSDYPDYNYWQTARIVNIEAYELDSDGNKTDKKDNSVLRINDMSSEEENSWQIIGKNRGAVCVEFTAELENGEQYTNDAIYEVSKWLNQANIDAGDIYTYAQGSEFSLSGSLTRYRYREEDLVYPGNWNRKFDFEWVVTEGSDYVEITPDNENCKVEIKDNLFNDDENEWEDTGFNLRLNVYSLDSNGERSEEPVACQESWFRIAEQYTEYGLKLEDYTDDSLDEIIETGQLSIPFEVIRYDENNPEGKVLSGEELGDINLETEIWEQRVGNNDCEIIDRGNIVWDKDNSVVTFGVDTDQIDGSEDNYPLVCRINFMASRDDDGSGDIGFDKNREISVSVCQHSWECVGSCSEAHKLVCNYCGTVVNKEACEHSYEYSLSKKAGVLSGVILGKCTTCGEVDVIVIPQPSKIELPDTCVAYDGNEHKPSEADIKVIDANGDEIPAENYSINYTGDFKSIGKHSVEVNFKEDSDYTGTMEAEISIVEAEMSVTSEGYENAYDGESHGITVNAPVGATVKYGETEEACNLDECPTKKDSGKYTVYYEVTFDNHKTVKGSELIVITQAVLSANDVIIEECTYNGSKITPEVSIDGKKISSNLVYCFDNVNAGEAIAFIQSPSGGNYAGMTMKHFTINPKSIDGESLIGTISDQTYTGKQLKPTIKIAGYTSDDYDAIYSNNVNVGVASVYVQGKGNYTGTSVVVNFKISPKGTNLGAITAATGALTVKWTKQATQTTGYELQYGTKSSFSGAKTVAITKNSTVSKKLSSLSKKKTYYVRIRTYKQIGDVKYYSAWSAKKSAKTK